MVLVTMTECAIGSCKDAVGRAKLVPWGCSGELEPRLTAEGKAQLIAPLSFDAKISSWSFGEGMEGFRSGNTISGKFYPPSRHYPQST